MPKIKKILILIFFSQHAWAAQDSITGNITINNDTTNEQFIAEGANNITLINNATINNADRNGSVRVFVDGDDNGLTGVTVINNADGIIKQDTLDDGTVFAEFQVNFTLINSGTISSNDGVAVNIKKTTDAIITNNAGGLLTAKRNTIRCSNSCTNPTINNFGTITGRQEGVIRLDKSTGMTVNNNVGGIIDGDGTNNLNTIEIGTNGTLINSGTIRRTVNGAPGLENNLAAIKYEGDNGTVLLKDDSILVGLIHVNSLKTDAKLQVQHGYGRSYMYQTLGELELADLSGNRIVKGSATAVGMGAQETVDELLGHRAYNLRAT